MQLKTTSNWQVSVRIKFNNNYYVNYAFEPMTSLQADGEIQLNHITVSCDQVVSQGDTIGCLHAPAGGAHVDFSLFKNSVPIYPEPYFDTASRKSILNLIHQVWPNGQMCYE